MSTESSDGDLLALLARAVPRPSDCPSAGHVMALAIHVVMIREGERGP